MKVIRQTIVLTVVVAMLSTSALVADEEGPGLDVGKKAPKIELKNQNGDVVKVAELLEKGPVAVVFHRSANW